MWIVIHFACIFFHLGKVSPFIAHTKKSPIQNARIHIIILLVWSPVKWPLLHRVIFKAYVLTQCIVYKYDTVGILIKN